MIARAAIVAEARRWIGTPYAHQASLHGVGCDCLGLVRGVWRHLIGDEPEPLIPYAPDWPLACSDNRLLHASRRCLDEKCLDDARPGDVILFCWRQHLPASHMAIIAEASTFIHAHEGACVTEVAFSGWWRRHAVAAFSFPGTEQ